MATDIENGAVLRIAESERGFVDHPGNIAQCRACQQELDTSDTHVMELYDGWIHEDCLEDYCEFIAPANDYAAEFVEQHNDEFVEYVRSRRKNRRPA